mmetsp:Transcript_15219/g.24655  ORF Transcript_15219/g.24655 Transcript_15219/m.24655 type:complete len:81 (-) Transcript_15219:1077-1319(-)
MRYFLLHRGHGSHGTVIGSLQALENVHVTAGDITHGYTFNRTISFDGHHYGNMIISYRYSSYHNAVPLLLRFRFFESSTH